MKAQQLVLALGMLLLAACGGNKDENGNPPKVTTAPNPADTVLPARFYKRLEGTIAGKHVVMHLQRIGDVYDGMYYYQDQGKWLLLNYIKDSSNNTDIWFSEVVALTTNSEQDANPPLLRMHYAGGSLKGDWKNKEGKTYPIDLKESYPPGSYHFSPLLFIDTAVAFPEKTNSPVARISESFPLAIGAGDTAWINNRIIRLLDFDTTLSVEQGATKSHTSYLKSYREESKKMAGEEATAFLNYEQGHTIAIRYNKNDLLLLESLYYAYEGGAHGNYGTTLTCYDVKNKREITLGDIVKADSSVLQPILEKRFRQQVGLKAGMSLNTVLFEEHLSTTDNFYFTEQGLGFVYNPYEIASYAQGTIHVFVPFSDLQPYLNTELVKRIQQ